MMEVMLFLMLVAYCGLFCGRSALDDANDFYRSEVAAWLVAYGWTEYDARRKVAAFERMYELRNWEVSYRACSNFSDRALKEFGVTLVKGWGI